MTADFNKPDLASTKTNFPGEIREAVKSACIMDYTGDSNLVNGFLKYNRSTGIWQERLAGVFTNMVINNLRTAPAQVTPTVTPSAGTWTDTGSHLLVVDLGGVQLVGIIISGSSSSNCSTLDITHASLKSGTTFRGAYPTNVFESAALTPSWARGFGAGNGISINKVSGNWTAGNALVAELHGVTFY